MQTTINAEHAEHAEQAVSAISALSALIVVFISQRPLGIKTQRGANYCALTMRRPRKCSVWRATPNCGKQITSSKKWQTKSGGDTPSAPRTWVRILANLVSRSMIHTSVAKDPLGLAASTVVDVWWDADTMPRIHYPKIICILRRRMGQKSGQRLKRLI